MNLLEILPTDILKCKNYTINCHFYREQWNFTERFNYFNFLCFIAVVYTGIDLLTILIDCVD